MTPKCRDAIAELEAQSEAAMRLIAANAKRIEALRVVDKLANPDVWAAAQLKGEAMCYLGKTRLTETKAQRP